MTGQVAGCQAFIARPEYAPSSTQRITASNVVSRLRQSSSCLSPRASARALRALGRARASLNSESLHSLRREISQLGGLSEVVASAGLVVLLLVEALLERRGALGAATITFRMTPTRRRRTVEGSAVALAVQLGATGAARRFRARCLRGEPAARQSEALRAEDERFWIQHGAFFLCVAVATWTVCIWQATASRYYLEGDKEEQM